MKQEIIDLYDEFTHRGLDRRVFMSRLAELAGGTAAAAAALACCAPNPAGRRWCAPDDPRLDADTVTIREGSRRCRATCVRPEGAAEKLPAVIVVHENRGLNPHTAGRGAAAGARRLHGARGGLPVADGRHADGQRGQGARDDRHARRRPRWSTDAEAAIAWLKARPDSNGKVGIVGFCWGGGVVGRVAAADADLDAGVVFYGQRARRPRRWPRSRRRCC